SDRPRARLSSRDGYCAVRLTLYPDLSSCRVFPLTSICFTLVIFILWTVLGIHPTFEYFTEAVGWYEERVLADTLNVIGAGPPPFENVPHVVVEAPRT